MQWKSHIVCLFVIAFLCSGTEARRKKAKDRRYDESSLIKSLLPPKYNNLVRPQSGQGADDVHFSLIIRDIVSVKEGTMEASITFMNWANMEWKDPRLTWNSTLYNNITTVRLQPQSIWTPDIVLQNSLDARTQLDAHTLAVVSSDGTVSLVSPVEMAIHCGHPSDPHSNWQCSFKFMSWTRVQSELNLMLRTSQADTSLFNNRVWEVTENVAERHAVKYECCPGVMLDVVFTVGLLRR